jgi:hypothetical protein
MASDASGNTLMSMGTEGNYTGPELAMNPEQDLSGFENPMTVIQSDPTRPPMQIVRPPSNLRPALPSGPINPR